MNNQNKKSSIVSNIIAVIIFTAIPILLFALNAGYLLDSQPMDIVDLISENQEATKGEYVSVNVDAVVEHYAETKHKINGIIPIGTDNHYLLWLEDDSFISLTANGKKLCDKLDDIMNDTQSYLIGSAEYLPAPFVVEGRIGTMHPEIKGYYEDALNYWGISSVDGVNIQYVTIDETDSKASIWLMMAFFVAIDIFCIVGLIKEIKNNKAIDAQAVMASTDVTFGDAFNSDSDNLNM